MKPSDFQSLLSSIPQAAGTAGGSSPLANGQANSGIATGAFGLPLTNQTPLANSGTPNQIGGITSSGIGSLPVLKQITQLGTGIGSGVGTAALGTLSGASRLVGKGQDILGGLINKIIGTKNQPQGGDQARQIANAIDTVKTDIFQKPNQDELSSVSGEVGNIVGQAAPYALGAGEANATVGNGVKGLISGSGALPSVARTAAGALTEAGLNTAEGYLTSGGDKKAALTQGAMAGLLDGVTSGIGEAANALKTPESLMMKVFKTNKAEVGNTLRGNGGDTIAKQALDRGIGGTVSNMAQQITTGMSDAEKTIAGEFQKAGNPNIVLENPQRFIDAIQQKASLLERSGATTEAQGLKSSLSAINPETGEISAGNALSLRRYLDGLRNEKAFLQPTEELNAAQAGLKEMTDEIRHKVNAIGGVGDAMKDYQFYIKALDKLTDYAKSSGNKQTLNIIQQGLLGDSLIHGSPLGVLGVLGNKIATGTAAGATGTAQLLSKLPISSASGAATRSIIGQNTAKLLGQ